MFESIKEHVHGGKKKSVASFYRYLHTKEEKARHKNQFNEQRWFLFMNTNEAMTRIIKITHSLSVSFVRPTTSRGRKRSLSRLYMKKEGITISVVLFYITQLKQQTLFQHFLSEYFYDPLKFWYEMMMMKERWWFIQNNFHGDTPVE